jgi:hypothetical protein
MINAENRRQKGRGPDFGRTLDESTVCHNFLSAGIIMTAQTRRSQVRTGRIQN